MRVLMFFSTDIPVCDGIAAHVVGLAKRLRSRGYNITLMTRGSWHGIQEFEYIGFKVIKIPFYPFYPFHVYFHGLFVRKAIKALSPQPDLIHLHSPLVPSLPNKWPIVTTFHTPMLIDTSYVENVGLKTVLIKLMGKTTSYWIENGLLKISDAVIAVSDGVAEEIRHWYGFKGNNLYTVPNIVDSNFFKPANYAITKKKLLYIGRLAYRKGLFEIVHSAENVVKRHSDVKYVLVGSGPLEKDLRKLVKRLNLHAHVEFYGEVRDPNKILHLYQNAWSVLIPSYYESGPLTLLEAMACGKAVITTETGLAKGLVQNGLNGLLIKPKSIEELSEATNRLLSTNKLCNNLGKAARKSILREMNEESNTNSIEKIYNLAIDKFNKTNTFVSSCVNINTDEKT